MTGRHSLAAASRDGHLALRRVERQQELIEILSDVGPLPVRELADRLAVSTRTVERDIERLRDAGVPFASRRGRTGGITLTPARSTATIELDTAEIVAIISSLTIVGPNSSPSASAAMAKLVTALH